MLMVKKAIKKAVIHADRIIHIENGALYAKPSSQSLIKYQATGDAIKKEITTNIRKSFDSSVTIPALLAPNTLRMPISLVRCSTVKVVNPNKPRHEIKMATIVK